MQDTRNILDCYKGWETDLIRNDVQSKTFPYAALMTNIVGDFNIATMIRCGNAFGCREVFYYGKRKWDRRGTVGTHHYTSVKHISTLDSLKQLKDKYRLIGLEVNTSYSPTPLYAYDIQPNSLFIFGEEAQGIPDEILQLCDDVIYVPMYGSVRSLNVATCSAIVFSEAARKFSKQ